MISTLIKDTVLANKKYNTSTTNLYSLLNLIVKYWIIQLQDWEGGKDALLPLLLSIALDPHQCKKQRKNKHNNHIFFHRLWKRPYENPKQCAYRTNKLMYSKVTENIQIYKIYKSDLSWWSTIRNLNKLKTIK